MAPAKPNAERKETWAKGLTDSEYAFVLQYLVDFNGTQAIIRAGLHKGDNLPAAAVRGTEMRQKPHVARAIDDALREDSSGIRQWLVAKLRAFIDADLTDLMEWTDDGKIFLVASKKLPKELSMLVKKITRTKDGDVKIELHDPMRAIEQMTKLAALHQRPNTSESEGDVLERLIYAALELKHKRESGE